MQSTMRLARGVCGRFALAAALSLLLAGLANASDISFVYVRSAIQPAGESRSSFAEPGSDLVLRAGDGSERVLVECRTCAVLDPAVSPDGEWVYYVRVEDARDPLSPALIFKTRTDGLSEPREIQLTHADGFDGALFQAVAADDANDLARWLPLRDRSPRPLADGRVAFLSNRAALVASRHEGDVLREAVRFDLFSIDDHDGRWVTGQLANLRRAGVYGRGFRSDQSYGLDLRRLRSGDLADAVDLEDGSLAGIDRDTGALVSRSSDGTERWRLDLSARGESLAQPGRLPDGGLLLAFRSNDGSRSGVYRLELDALTAPDSRRLELLAQSSGWSYAQPRLLAPTSPRIERSSGLGSTSGGPSPTGVLSAVAATPWVLSADAPKSFDVDAVYALRVVAVLPTPFRKPAPVDGLARPDADPIVRGFDSQDGQRRRILAEIPVRKTHRNGALILDATRVTDTSFAVRVPANTPICLQLIDRFGHALWTESESRSLRAGERQVRGDAQGLASSATGLRIEFQVQGVDADSLGVDGGVWDAAAVTPLLASDARGADSVGLVERGSVGVEFFRDVVPVLLALGFADADLKAAANDADLDAARTARASLSARLSTCGSGELAAASLEECRTVARWIDLGCPVDLPSRGHDGFRYTDDVSLPLVRITEPGADGVLRVGALDLESTLDWATLTVLLDANVEDGVQLRSVDTRLVERAAGSDSASLRVPGLLAGREALLVVFVADLEGNLGRTSLRFRVSNGAPRSDVAGAGDRPGATDVDRTHADGRLASISSVSLESVGYRGNELESGVVALSSAATGPAAPESRGGPIVLAAGIETSGFPTIPLFAMAVFDPTSSVSPEVADPVVVQERGGVGAGSGPSSEPGDVQSADTGSLDSSRTGCSASGRSGDPGSLLVLLVPFAVGLLRRRRLQATRAAARGVD